MTKVLILGATGRNAAQIDQVPTGAAVVEGDVFDGDRPVW